MRAAPAGPWRPPGRSRGYRGASTCQTLVARGPRSRIVVNDALTGGRRNAPLVAEAPWVAQGSIAVAPRRVAIVGATLVVRPSRTVQMEQPKGRPCGFYAVWSGKMLKILACLLASMAAAAAPARAQQNCAGAIAEFRGIIETESRDGPRRRRGQAPLAGGAGRHRGDLPRRPRRRSAAGHCGAAQPVWVSARIRRGRPHGFPGLARRNGGPPLRRNGCGTEPRGFAASSRLAVRDEIRCVR